VSESANTAPHHATGAPLAGRSIVVTRSADQAAALADPLRALGAEVIAMPVLEVVDPPDLEPIDSAIQSLATYHWVVLTSTNAVDRLVLRMEALGKSVRLLKGVKVAAIGSTTAERMRALGVEPDLVPQTARAEGLVLEFERLGVGKGCRILIPRALRAREVLPYALRLRGAVVDVAPVYQTVPVPPDPAVLVRLDAGTIDCVTFTSGAIARGFVSAIEEAGIEIGRVMREVTIASIGPVTTHDIEELGYRADIEAKRATMPALADAIAAFFEPRES
jgi:uroporphyrinogen III methyltransferase/synthase